VSSVAVIHDTEFSNEVLGADSPVLVYLWAAWCGPCRLVSPSIDWIAQNYDGKLKVVKMEVDANPETVKAYKVEGVPAIRLFKSGEQILAAEGAMTKAKIVSMMDEHL
jgi:thioredoxin 1